jgi:hypothetical protein
LCSRLLAVCVCVVFGCVVGCCISLAQCLHEVSGVGVSTAHTCTLAPKHNHNPPPPTHAPTHHQPLDQPTDHPTQPSPRRSCRRRCPSRATRSRCR